MMVRIDTKKPEQMRSVRALWIFDTEYYLTIVFIVLNSFLYGLENR